MSGWSNEQYRGQGGRGRGFSSYQQQHRARPSRGRSSALLMSVNRHHNPIGFDGDTASSSTSRWKPLPPAASGHTDLNQLFDELYEIEHLWKLKNKQAAICRFTSFISNTVTPYSCFLTMLSNCSDLREMKTVTLAFSLAKEFNQWVKSFPPQIEQLTEELQLRAFELSTSQGNMLSAQFFELIISSFKLQAVSYFAHPFCKKLMNSGKLKDAAIVINSLKLHSDYDLLNELIIPLLLQDKINVIESLVWNSVEEQVKLVQFLDKISNRQFDLGSIVPSGIKDIKISLNHRVMMKLGTRLMKKYKVSADKCPFLARSQGMAFIRHLLFRFYQERSLVYDNWAELTQGALPEELETRIEFVNLLASYDLPEAHQWYLDLGLPANEIASDIVNYEATEPQATEEEDWELEAATPSYYQLKLPLDNVIMVNNEPGFYEATNNIIKAESGCVGVDAEWKPCFSAGSTTRLAILQISTWTTAYILDIIALQRIEHLDWSPLVDGIFMNVDLLKIGYGFTEDQRMLRQAIPIWGDRNISNLIDICNVQSAVCQAKGIVPNSSSEKGLSGAVRLFLGGLVLDKAEQMSDWERRPLRRTQLVYAALDAFCLLELWKVLETMANELNLYICAETYKKVGSSKKGKGKNKKKGGKSPKSSEQKTTVFGDSSHLPSQNTAGSIKFVVSNMLQGLGKQLRLLGVDVHIIDDQMGDDHDDAARISHTQNRIILTAGKPFERLSAISPAGSCFAIDTELSARHQALAVLKHFNIAITKENIFSRCQTCNNDIYIIIDRFIMADMWRRYQPHPAPSLEHCALLKPSTGYSRPNIQLSNGIYLQLDPVSQMVLSKVDAFFCCALCGKVFWEGSHYDRVQKNFEHVLTLTDEMNQQPEPSRPTGRPV